MPCAPQKSKVAAARTTQLVRKLEKRQTPRNPNACLFPLIPIKGSLEGHEKNIFEKGQENH